eukprot:gene215-biopygen649
MASEKRGRKKDSTPEDTEDPTIKDLVILFKKQDSNFNTRMDELTRKVETMNKITLDRLKEIENRMSSFEKSAEFLSKKYDDQRKTSENLIKSQTKLEKENENLFSSIQVLTKKLDQQTTELNDLEQYGRRECVEISGIVPFEGENPEEIALKVFKSVGVAVEEKDIVACHRLRKAKGDPVIIAKFLNRKNMESVMRQRRNLKGVTAGSLGFPVEEDKKNNKIFLNESLTKRNKNLFRLVRLQCIDKNWSSFWTRNGIIFAKKDDHSAPTKISNEEDINRKIV